MNGRREDVDEEAVDDDSSLADALLLLLVLVIFPTLRIDELNRGPTTSPPPVRLLPLLTSNPPIPTPGP